MKTMDEHVNDYVQYLRTRYYSEQTIKKIYLAVHGFTKWLHLECDVETPDRLHIRHIDSWQQHLLNWRTVKGLPLKPSTLNVRINSVSGLLQYLSARGYVLSNLLKILQRAKMPMFLPQSVLTHIQVKKFFNSIDTSNTLGYRNRALLELMYSCGLRAKEVLGLNVGDVQFDHGTALVHGKGNKDRIVPIGKTALRYLQSYLVGVRPFLVHDPREQAFFVTERGNRCRYHVIKNWLKKYTDRIDLDVRISSHTFRRSCTTEMIRAGANIYHVKELLGHESLETLKHYVKLNITDLKKTHEKTHPRERDS
ncbi:MAG: hypothetical protein CV087_05550 [Candidatus Brocadia sp. WS118]|nr:MAG: hypothetical protein CV087_05550 [Candidatus Brocadia sp. WS118]